MVHSKKILFSVITFIVLSLIIILCLYSYNNLDTANAFDFYNGSSVVEMGFPFAYNDTYVNSAFMNYFYNWNGWKVVWYDNVRFAGSNCIGNIDTSLVDFGSFQLPITHYNLGVSNSDYYCIVAFPCSLISGSSYYFNFVLNNSNAGYVGSGVSIVQSFSYNNGSLTKIDDLFEINFTNVSSSTKFNNFYFFSEVINLENSCDYIGIVFKNTSMDLYFNVADNVTFLSSNFGSFVASGTGSNLNDVMIYKSHNDYDFNIINTLFKPNEFVGTVTFNLYLDGNLYTVNDNSTYPYYSHYQNDPNVNMITYELVNASSGRVAVINLFNPLYVSNGDLRIEIFTRNQFTFNNYSITMFAEYGANSGYSVGYSQGVADGLAKQENSFNTGYNEGYSTGYNSGYNNGLSVASNGSFLGLLSAAIESPLNAVLNMFDFEILGYNMKAFYLGLFTVAMILFIIKLFLGNVGGKKGD